MTGATLARRSIAYYWRSHLGTIAGAGIATAVLTGALLVGDSVRGSLRAMALARLGSGDEAAEFFHMLNPLNHTRTPADVSLR